MGSERVAGAEDAHSKSWHRAARVAGLSLAAAFAAERERWRLFVPAAFGLGIGLYFAWPSEPAAWLGAAALAASLPILLAGRRWAPLFLLGGALAAGATGFLLAQARTARVAAPVLGRSLGPAVVEGRLIAAEALAAGERLIIEHPVIAGLSPAATPARVRVTLRRPLPGLRPGLWVRVRAQLLPPPPPAEPGAFDFPRQAFFQRLGAVGFALGQAAIIPPPPAAGAGALSDRATLLLHGIRHDVSQRIFKVLPGAVGGMAAALTTGERSYVPERVQAVMRDAGLAHLLAIAGLHLSLVAGGLFFMVRLLIAAIPVLALTGDGKKWAAAVSLLGAFLYLLMSGAAVPTQRAFIMTAAVLLAILLDRRPVSLYLVGWAALVVLAIQPESLLQAGFQMSFAAVLALVAAYEVWGSRFGAWHQAAGPGRRVALHLFAIAFTSLVAGLATAPFALYHFDRFVTYGLIGNILAVPITAFWVMPWAMVAFLLMPFHLESLGLIPMGLGIGAVIRVATFVAGLPGDVILMPQMPQAGMLLLVAGGLWLCLWRRRWRLYGLLPIALGLATIALTPRPDLVIAGNGRLLALRQADGRLTISPGRGNRMAVETWLERDGAARAAPWPLDGATTDGTLRCDPLGCFYRRHGILVALPVSEAALPTDCSLAQIVVSRVPVPGQCHSARLVIDAGDLARQGAYALYIAANGRVRVENVAGYRGLRPWSMPPARQFRPDSPPGGPATASGATTPGGATAADGATTATAASR